VNGIKYNNIFPKFLINLLLALAIIIPINSFAAEDIDKIKKELDDMNWKVRLAAVEKLIARNDEDAINLLLKVAGTRSEYWPIKIKAITFLGETKDPRAIDILLSTFNDTFQNWECPSIKSYTATALGNFKGNTKVVDALIEGITDRELLTREASIRSLGKIGSPKAVPYIIDALHDKSFAIKDSAINALESIGDPQAIPHLQRVAENDTDTIIKRDALMALKNIQKKTISR
jgi:HEAT repeat protein